MPYAAIPARFIEVVVEQREDTVRWGKCRRAPEDVFGHTHAAEKFGSERKPGQLKPIRSVRKGWRGSCRYCGTSIKWHLLVTASSGIKRTYNTASGRPEPGDLYWDDHGALRECFHWDNCDGRHLHGILPNGHAWDIDSRANNCGSPDDRLHRCWIRSGEPPKVTAGKQGNTCSAGGGSILSGDYHGFLVSGVFTAG